MITSTAIEGKEAIVRKIQHLVSFDRVTIRCKLSLRRLARMTLLSIRNA